MTTHRSLAALATVGILLLSACNTTQPDPSDDTATTATTSAALKRDPHPVTTPLPEADVAGLWLPLTFQDLPILDPGWDTEVLYADGVFLGAIDHGDRLEYTAVDVHGEVLWAAERPSGSTDFSLRTHNDGSATAVLPDSGPDGATTVNGYDLTTGDLTWGPEEPPGRGTRGSDGSTETTEEGSQASVDGEHLDPATGTRIILHGSTLRAEDPAGSELWSLSITEDTHVAGLAGGLLYLREGDAIRAHNIVTGAVAQAYDPEGQGRVVVPKVMVTEGAALLMDGERPLIAVARDAPPAP